MAAALLALLALALLAWSTRPAPLEPPATALRVEGDPEAWLQRREARAAALHPLVPGTEKRIRWAGAAGQRTELALVYLHGFSATRQELAPVPARIASALGANLFETRLAGHGRRDAPLAGVRAEDWLQDGVEALAIGRRLGERIAIMGVSTGATLALALARHPDFRSVDTLILVSPNFGPAERGAELLTGPLGPQLARLLLGAERSWEAQTAEQARYWATRYPTASVLEMMRLVHLARRLVGEVRVDNALLVYSPQDSVVSVPQLLAGFDSLPAARKQARPMSGGSPSRHVLAGDILAPENNAPLAAAVTAFLRGPPAP